MNEFEERHRKEIAEGGKDEGALNQEEKATSRRINVKSSWLAKIRTKLRPFKYCFMFALFLWTFLSILPFVKYSGDPSLLQSISKQNPSTFKYKGPSDYCKYRLQKLLGDYKNGIPLETNRKPKLLSDNPAGLQAKMLSKYFKILPFTTAENSMDAFKNSEVFWFENRRLPLNTSKPCSLFFQNSVEGYHQLHLKHELARLAKKNKVTSKYIPRTYVLDDENDCKEFFHSNRSSSEAEEPRYVVKNEGKDVEVVTEDLWNNLKKSFNNCTKNQGQGETMLVAQELIKEPVLYKEHKMDFRVYFVVNSAKPLLTTFYNGFGRVCPARFNKTSFLPRVHISNLRTTFDTIKQAGLTAIEDEPAEEFSIKTFEETQVYLKEKYNLDFMHLTDKLKDKITRLLKASKIAEARPNSQFQLFAADYIITTEGLVKLLEINAFPDFIDNSNKKTKIYKTVFNDLGWRMRNKLWHTKRILRRMVEDENFNEDKAIAEAIKTIL